MYPFVEAHGMQVAGFPVPHISPICRLHTSGLVRACMCVCVCTCGLACATHVAHLQVAHTWACGICLCPKVAPAPQLGSPKAPAVCLVLCMETSYSISLVCSWPSSQVDPKTGVPTLFYTGELTFPVSCGQASFGRHALDMHKLEPHPQQLRAPQ